ncbi:3,4-dihydroxy-2-butanone-4-phosphate synthase [Streptomyces sp. NPDC006446]|uniref:3,4-dihydroxy-2-butanone-4-phosphate synthase n=1 Tax=Streptomyces sp. NPDC006446 TaxID=3154301 RepID=UPI0033B88F82
MQGVRRRPRVRVPLTAARRRSCPSPLREGRRCVPRAELGAVVRMCAPPSLVRSTDLSSSLVRSPMDPQERWSRGRAGPVTSVSMPRSEAGLDTVAVAVEELRVGRPVIVVDDADREDEGDLIMAAQFATAETLGFFVRWTSGLICAPMAPEVADRLELPLMVPSAPGADTTAYTVTVDAVGVGSGISAADRALTVRTLADAGARPDQLVRPGHVLPLRARSGGIAERRGHTEATVDLLRLAGLSPVGVISEVCEEDGSVARFDRLRAFADEHGLALVSIEQLSHAVGRSDPMPA